MKKLSLSNVNIYFLHDGSFWLDGGSVFGIIPKVFWEKQIYVDPLNRIKIPVNNILIETEKHKILVDTGIGNKLSPKLHQIYNISQITPNTKNELKKIGISPKDIDIVILTHLHFDHAGGIVSKYENEFFLSYPNAIYYIQKKEWEVANYTNKRTKGSYIKKDFALLKTSEKLKLINGNHIICKNVSLLHTPGHTEGMQIVHINNEKQSAYFLGDLIPNNLFLQWVYISGFDLYPLSTLSNKEQILTSIYKTNSIVLFQHDLEYLAATLEYDEKGYKIGDKIL